MLPKSPAFELELHQVQGAEKAANVRYQYELAIWNQLSPEDPDKTPRPKPRRYSVGDTTIEAVVSLLGRTPRGLLLACDEAAVFFERMNAYLFLLTAFQTGLRLSELFGLAWDDIDFAGHAIEVRRGYSHGRFSTPKSRKGRRVDMSDQLAQTLLEHRQVIQVLHGRLPVTDVTPQGGKASSVQLVFPNQSGGPADGDNFLKRMFVP
ncbi:MAG: tyrosine-type recombinase/integrase [Planctomycetota bacterium]